MNKIVCLITLCMVLFLPMQAASKLDPKSRGFVVAWGQVGYAAMLNSTQDIRPSWGGSPTVGFGYRYFRKGWLIQTGVEGQYAYLTNKITNAAINLDMYDTEGEQFVMRARVDNCLDVTQLANVHIPFYVGYEYNRFYMLAGASVGVNIWGRAHTKASVSTQGIYDDFMDPFEDMPNHQLYKGLPVNSKAYQVGLRMPNVDVHLEMGGRLTQVVEMGNQIRYHMFRVYLAAFADYSVLNVHQDNSVGSTFSYKQDPGKALTFEVVPCMVSNQLMRASVNPLVVGIKVTLLWELPEKKICIICDD